MLLKLLRGLDRSRFAPVVISLTTLGDLGPSIQALGIPVHALGMRSWHPNIRPFSRLIGHLIRIRPDIVHTWMYHADLVGGLAARLTRTPALVWGIRHGNLEKKNNKLSTLFVVKFCALLSRWVPQRILTCSNSAIRVHVAEGYVADKMVLIPNGFDLTEFALDVKARRSIRCELRVPADAPLVGFVGRYNIQKNHLGFLRAAAAVHQVVPRCHFVMAGTGVDSTNKLLLESIAREGLQGHVHMLGKRSDMPRLMASLDVLACPSLGEAFPNVLGEAMACAVPCVVTDVGDSADIIHDAGRVVSDGDMHSFAQQLIELLQMPSEQREALGLKARQRIREFYELGDIIRQYEAVYSELRALPAMTN
jgi:glycosyltransferase involved in cell wall biosynthesis